MVGLTNIHLIRRKHVRRKIITLAATRHIGITAGRGGRWSSMLAAAAFLWESLEGEGRLRST